MRKHFRALRKGCKALGIVAGATWRAMRDNPEGDELQELQEKFYTDLCKAFGISVVFNEQAAPLRREHPTLYVANHTSYGDFMALGMVLNSSFAGKGEILTWPLFRHAAKAAKYIGLRREAKYNEQSYAKLNNNLNDGLNVAFFPEATIPESEPERGVDIGDEVYRFRKGMFPVAMGVEGKDKQGNVVELNPEVAEQIRVQPLGITVEEVNGQADAHENKELRQYYTGHNKKGMLSQFWQMLTAESIVVKVTTGTVLNPSSFSDEFQLANEAHRQVASIVAPNQTEAYFALIPGENKENRKPPVPVAQRPEWM